MTGRPRESLENKFWRKVIKGKSKNDCWGWDASCFKAGYGQITHGYRIGEHLSLKAHRVSYEIHFGKIPKGALVCHTCDTPSCSNPKHLYLGTPKSNVQDMIKRGRRYDTSGVNNGQSKITEKDVKAIRRLYAKNTKTGRVRKEYSQKRIADMFGISQSVVYDIVRRNYWSHVK